MKKCCQQDQRPGAARAFMLMLSILILVSAATARAAAPSPLDGFDPNASSYVTALAVQADGKVLVGGDFTTVSLMARNRIARLNPDGSLDAAFNPGAGANGSVACLALQPDGKVLLGGAFTSINGVARNHIARLNADGSLDTTFDPGTGAGTSTYIVVRNVTVQPDGKVLLGGNFTTINGTARNGIARLNANGSLDTSFNAGTRIRLPSSQGYSVYTLALQPDGKVLLGGYFLRIDIDGRSRFNIARLNADGSLDTTFKSDGVLYNDPASGGVFALALLNDGKMLLGGRFSTVNGTARKNIARLNADGSLDTAFDASAGATNTDSVRSLALQPDGKVLLGGAFTSINNRAHSNIARLNTDGALETSFDAGKFTNVPISYNQPLVMYEGGTVAALAVQADGKLLLGGDFAQINGVARNNIARLHANGSLETTFDPEKGANDQVSTLAVQPDSKILLGGKFTQINGTARNNIARMNADGTLDAAFDPGTGPNGSVRAMALQPDGKVLLGGDFTSISLTARGHIARLNADGSLDATFKPGTGANGSVMAVALQPDGKVLLGGNFTSVSLTARYRIARLNTDGSLDASFDAGKFTSGMFTFISALAVQADGKVLLAGFIISGGGSAYKIARLNADGSLDASFDTEPYSNMISSFNMTSPFDIFADALTVQADGKILVGANFTSVEGQFRNPITRLNTNGSLDTDFDAGQFANTMYAPINANALALQADGKILVGGAFTSINGTPRNNIARLGADGSLDTPFEPETGVNDTVATLAAQPDGKVLLGGSFTTINGTARSRIARLNAGGSLDMAFNPGTGANARVNALALQPDGKVLLGGGFTQINGTARKGIARLDARGSLDTSFDPGTGAEMPVVDANAWVNALALQPDGKVLLGGFFTAINGATRKGIARLNADGSLDATFNPGPGAIYQVNALALQPDGKVLLGGNFSNLVNGTARNNITRLNADGSLDATFDPGTGANDQVNALVLQPDGRVLLCGNFTGVHSTGRSGIARLNADGSLDTTFNTSMAALSDIYPLALQADGKILLSGSFYSIYSGFYGIVRLNADGSLDSASGPVPVVDHDVINGVAIALALQADGKALLGGRFNKVNATARKNIARLSNPDAALPALSVAPGGSSATWTLGGSYPQPYQVLFEQSADGTSNTWSVLGWGVPVPGGYRLSGLHLPVKTNHYLRATGWVTGGQSVSLYQSVLQFHDVPPNFILAYTAGAHGSIDGATSRTQTADRGSSGSPVTAVPDIGYHFIQWSDTRTDNPRTDTNVTTNITVTASFAINQYTLAYRAGAHGSIDGATSKTQMVSHGASGSQVTAVPAAGYRFVQWSDGSTANPRIDINVTTTKSVTAAFAISQYTLTYTVGAHGLINGTTTTKTHTVNYGLSGPQITAVPDTGYHFVRWSDGVLTAARTDTNVTANMSVTASFAINQYNVAFRTDGRFGASLSNTTTQTVNYKSNCTAVTARAPAGSFFVKWTKNGATYSTLNPLTVTNVTENMTLIAVFGPYDSVKDWSVYD